MPSPAVTTPRDALLREIVRINPLQQRFLEAAVAAVGGEDLAGLDLYLEYCTRSGLEVEYLARCYDLIVKDTLREQIYFQRHGRYRHSSYAEVAGSVYMSDEYMSKYMYGLALTSFLWPQHVRMRRYFEASVPRDRRGSYLEIGPGHGYYFMKAMRLTSFDRFDGIDISPTSVRMSRQILESGVWGDFSAYRIFEADFLEMPVAGRYEAVVMGEVLEHVEDPGAFLRKIASVSTDDAFIYVTTCINAPAIDHIALFRSVGELTALVEASGLEVRDSLLVPYGDKTVEETEREKLSLNVAMVLAHP